MKEIKKRRAEQYKRDRQQAIAFLVIFALVTSFWDSIIYFSIQVKTMMKNKHPKFSKITPRNEESRNKNTQSNIAVNGTNRS